MRKILAASLTLAAFALPATALAKPPTRAHVGQYERAYRAVVAKFGRRAPGRHIVRDGMAHRRTSDADVVRSLGVLWRMLTPPPAPVVSAPVSARFSSSRPTLTSQGTYSSTVGGVCGGVTPYSGGGQCWAIPYSIVLCESHGQNVPNSSGSGAEGYYQLMSGGTGSRSTQDQAAAALWNGGKGAGNWDCK